MTLNAIIANFQTFKIVDLLDIIIIAFLIYQLLGIINRTRAGQLAKGALLVMVVYLVANTLNSAPLHGCSTRCCKLVCSPLWCCFSRRFAVHWSAWVRPTSGRPSCST